MENQHPEALILVNDRPSAIGDDLYQWALDAEDMIRRLHARVQELEKDRGNAKRLVSKIWNHHPEARDTIEKVTGAWLVFGQDVESDGVSAQRVTQGKDHTEQQVRELLAGVSATEAVAVPIGLYEAIAHGDEKHKQWLKAALEAFFKGGQIPQCDIASPQPQAVALDAPQTLIRPAAAQKIPWDPIPTVDTWETCTIKEAKELNPALWRVRMLYPQEAIDAAIAAAKESR